MNCVGSCSDLFNMIFKDLYNAIVEDNKDPDEAGRVKIRVESFMRGFQSDHLPWAKPYTIGSGGSSDYGQSWIPEIGSRVWVWFTDPPGSRGVDDEPFGTRMRHPYYMGDALFKELNPAKVFGDKVKPNLVTDETDDFKGGELNYPHVKFIMLQNGVCQFMSSDPDNPYYGIFHPSGSQILINPEGQVYIGSKSDQLDPVVSTIKLKEYLKPIVGNLGAPLFAPTIDAADLSFENFFAGIAGTVDALEHSKDVDDHSSVYERASLVETLDEYLESIRINFEDGDITEEEYNQAVKDANAEEEQPREDLTWFDPDDLRESDG